MERRPYGRLFIFLARGASGMGHLCEKQFPEARTAGGIDAASISEGGKGHLENGAQGAGKGWLIWILLAALPWLIPTHFDPWTTFYGDWAAALALLPLIGWAFHRYKKRLELSGAVLLVAIVPIIPLIQAVSGVLLFPGEAFVFASYILLVAISIFLGQRAELAGRERLIGSLFASFMLASFFSMGLALYQWLALDGLGVLVQSMDVGGIRVVANVGQPNNLSTLFALGVTACWWACARQKISAGIAIVSAAFFVLGIVLTGSRTGVLQLIFLAFALVWWRGPRFSWGKVAAIVLLMSWLVLLLFTVPIIGRYLFGSEGREILNVGLRAQIWSMAMRALVDAPWYGYGWNQFVVVHVLAAGESSALGGVAGQAHNFILDLLLWNGFFLGGVLVASMVWWGGSQITKVGQETHGVVLAAIGVFFVHAMLELPHLYLMFLVPVGLLVGAASAYTGSRVILTLPRYALIPIALSLVSLLIVTFYDYRKIEASREAHKMYAARIYGAQKQEPPEIYVLRALQQALELLDGEPGRGMSKERLAAMRRAIMRYPSTGGMFRYAQASALNGNFDEAKWALQLLCNLRNAKTCSAALNDWDVLAKSGNPEMKLVVLPTPP